MERHELTSSSDEPEDEEEKWQEKLEAEAEDDMTDAFGRHRSHFHDSGYFMGETYDTWADRIFAEFQRKRRPRTNVSKKPSPSQPQLKYQGQFLKRDLQLPRGPTEAEKYKQFCSETLADDAQQITVKDLPFKATADSSRIASVILESVSSDSANADETEIKKKIRNEIRLWHPDKFMQKYGHRLKEKEPGEVMKIVNHIAQSLIQYGKW